MSLNNLRQAITVKYKGPSNSTGSRMTASCLGGRCVFWYKAELSLEQNYFNAAEKLHKKLGWHKTQKLLGGTLSDGRVVFIQVDR